jgi:hypothetical protein
MYSDWNDESDPRFVNDSLYSMMLAYDRNNDIVARLRQ